MEVISILRHYVNQFSPQRVHDAIAALQPFDHEKFTGLIAALADNGADLRLLVIEILREFDPMDASLPALINALEDPDRIVKIAAVDPVSRFGEKAEAAVPIFQNWLDDERDYVRIAAAEAIGKIDPTKIPQIMPVLLNGLESEVRIDRQSAAEAMRDLGQGSENY